MLRPPTPLLLLLPLLVGLTACGPGTPDAPPAAPDAYETRGLVRQVPSAERPGSELHLHHEAIPDFKDAGGEVVGMDAMAMPFPVAEAAMLDGLAPGDKVVFTFEVRWEGVDPLRITRLEKLPPETRLAFEQNPEPPADENAETDESETPAP